MTDHPLPQFARDTWASLDGIWEVQLEPGDAWREIRVPFTFEAALSAIGTPGDVHERIRYRRSFRVPDEWKERTLLRFGGVDWRARVSLDGRVLGKHEGGYAHFSFDAGRLATGSEHELVVDVFDPADDAFGQPKGKQRGSGGIWYTRATGIWQPVWLEVDEPEVVGEPLPPRRVEARDGRILVDGVPRRLAGVLDQAYWPDGVYTAPSDDALRADVQAAHDFGFDLSRMHVKVADERWYDWCDRLGLLVAQDIPSPLRLDTAAARENFVRELDEIVLQFRRHPSIVMWVVFNEDWGEPPEDFQRELVRHVRELDPTRLVIDASGWKHRGDTDLVDVHDYGDDLSKHERVWVGECGGVSLVVEGEEDFAYKHVTSGDALAAEYARLVGTLGDVSGFVWTQLTDVEGELNGLMTHDRRPKVEPAKIRAVNERFREERR
ncbi:MAG: glycoside hydrolase family 2 TIM barrel-domain containing protein [Gaiellaceae bacterium]